MRLKALALVLSSTILFNGCASMNKTEKGALIGGVGGAAAGALWGAARGNAVEGALIGAGVGAAAGGTWGYILDKQAKELKEAGIKAERQKDNTLLVTMAGNTLKFETGKSTLSQDGQAQLAKVAGILAKYPQDRILIEGHTDNVGSAETNQVLSQQRADTVKNFMLYNGVQAASIISCTGYGDSQPLYSNASAEGRAGNRRVALKISVPADAQQ